MKLNKLDRGHVCLFLFVFLARKKIDLQSLIGNSFIMSEQKGVGWLKIFIEIQTRMWSYFIY